MQRLASENLDEQETGKQYLPPELIKYDSLKVLTLCTCRTPWVCACARGREEGEGEDCFCPYPAID